MSCGARLKELDASGGVQLCKASLPSVAGFTFDSTYVFRAMPTGRERERSGLFMAYGDGVLVVVVWWCVGVLCSENKRKVENVILAMTVNRTAQTTVKCIKCKYLIQKPPPNVKTMKCGHCKHSYCLWCNNATAAGSDKCMSANCTENPVYSLLRNNKNTQTIGAVSNIPQLRLCPACLQLTEHVSACKVRPTARVVPFCRLLWGRLTLWCGV